MMMLILLLIIITSTFAIVKVSHHRTTSLDAAIVSAVRVILEDYGSREKVPDARRSPANIVMCCTGCSDERFPGVFSLLLCGI